MPLTPTQLTTGSFRTKLERGLVMSYDSRAVANFILDDADARCLSITNMALNKIMYFAHGWSLGRRKRALVSASFEAWQHGPVLPLVYRQFAKHSARAITSRATAIDLETGRDVVVRSNLIPDDSVFVSSMVELFGPMSASTLRELSHEPGGPWDAVWNGREKINPGMTISQSLIEEHFRQRVERKNRTHVH